MVEYTPTEPTPTPTPTPVSTSITLSATSLSFASLDDTTQLAATVTDVNDEVIDSATVTWAATGGAATVSSAGLVTAVANGTATVTA
ncbi:MAG: cell adhesion protein, partial [Gemmatimonadetes bacterium]|nr:cell adhesion protein [Gemmatimonadota bacterium]